MLNLEEKSCTSIIEGEHDEVGGRDIMEDPLFQQILQWLHALELRDNNKSMEEEVHGWILEQSMFLQSTATIAEGNNIITSRQVRFHCSGIYIIHFFG